MELIPVQEKIEDNKIFTDDPDCRESVEMSVDFYTRVGFNPPWICYYARLEDQLVGCAAYKGKPVNGRVEIAYGVFPQYMNKGIGTLIAQTLVEKGLETDPSIIITARTLAEENYSTRILRKNNFKLFGTVIDAKDGELREWEYIKQH
jgi:ribosomal-protein-alanine N-acetyltransferase